ncbi:Methyltransferase domain-containing protein [Parasphingorhabdus marina DSM 22363]|uniref:Methyltransferase domain-containing protein n=2 Tax=Parasphingorhabdus marina TaxID=394732 RepID=A0A1N6GL16_9SPHN|nr:Methyltransferase domain-containing protein [Parasphingorhabdus marina DSM 22363]
MVAAILDNLDLVKRDFQHCLVNGLAAPQLACQLADKGMSVIVADASYQVAQAAKGVQCDEDRLPFADQSFDLAISIGTLDSVNDLPGALALQLRALKPDGLFLGAFVGAESLGTLKASLMLAEGPAVSAHVHPQIDIRTMGDLLTRIGYKLAVVDSDRHQLRYSRMDKLISDLRDAGGSNILAGHDKPLSRAIYQGAKKSFSEKAEPDGKISEMFEIVNICAWAPHPDQPLPARRGSGKVSLRTALDKDG